MEDRDPYASPEARVAPVAEEAMPLVDGAPLYRISGIGLATFLGTVLAGGVLLAMNERALGRPARALPIVLLSLAAMVAILVLAALLPDAVPGVVFTLPPLLAMIALARQLQGAAIQARIAAALPMRSNWRAAGIGLLVVAGLLATVALAPLAYLRATGLSFDAFMAA